MKQPNGGGYSSVLFNLKTMSQELILSIPQAMTSIEAFEMAINQL